MKTTTCKPKTIDCTLGCPAQIRYEVPSEWTCDDNGIPQIDCTDWADVLMEIQPYQAGSGEKSSCSVEGIKVDIGYQFWYEPQDNLHLVTPNSKFKAPNFDASLLFGTKSIVKFMGCDWLVWDLKNWLNGCALPSKQCEDEPEDPCEKITMQTGMLVPYAECKKDVKPTEPEYCDEINSGWVKVY